MLSGRYEVGQEAIGARYCVSDLAIDSVGNIDIGSFAVVRYQQTALLRILAGIVNLGERLVLRGPGFEERVAALLNPTVEIGRGDFVGEGEQGVVGIEQCDGRMLVNDFLGIAAESERVRSRELIALVLDEEGSSVADVRQQPRRGGGQVGPGRIRADADDDGVVSG